LGTKSFGKGSVQTIMPIAGNGAMRLTTARYYTPSGRAIQAKGVEPDIEVKQAKLEEIAQTRPRRSEADLRGALDTDKPEDADKKTDDAELSSTDDNNKKEADYQLSRAVDLIRGLAIMSTQAMKAK